MLRQVVDRIEKIITSINVVLILVLLSALFIEVMNRYVFGISWPQLQFVIPFCFLWSCMLGAAVAVRRNQHFEVDFLANFLKGRAKKFHAALMTLSVLVGGLILAWVSIDFVELGLLKKNSATGIRMIYIYASLLVGGILIALMALEQLITQNSPASSPDKTEV